jgi:hypothetical protein
VIIASFKVKHSNIDDDIFGSHSDECDLGSGARHIPLLQIVQKGFGFHPASYSLVTGAKAAGM